MKVLVTAVPGGGKSTVLQFVKAKLPEAKVITAGDIFLDIARERYGINDRDELRKKLTIEQQREIQEDVARKIAEEKGELVFVNTHVTIKTPFGYFPALSEKTMRIMKPDLIIILEFRPEDVLRRRKEDKSRKRDIESLEEIEEHQRVNRENAIALSGKFECPVEIINLRFEEREPYEQAVKGAEEIIKIVRRMREGSS